MAERSRIAATCLLQVVRFSHRPKTDVTFTYSTQADPEDIRTLEWLAMKCDNQIAYNLVTDLIHRRPYKRFVEVGPGGPMINSAREIKKAGSKVIEARRKRFEDLFMASLLTDLKRELDNQVHSKLDGRPIFLLDVSWRGQASTPVLLIRPGPAGHLEVLDASEALMPLYDDDSFCKQTGYVRVFVNPQLEETLAPFAESAGVLLQKALD
jgi:hypothetical protein